jgi:hypothetical protein
MLLLSAVRSQVATRTLRRHTLIRACPTPLSEANLPAEVAALTVTMSLCGCLLRICPNTRLCFSKQPQAGSSAATNPSQRVKSYLARFLMYAFRNSFCAIRKFASAVKLPMKSTDNKAGLQKGIRRCTSRSSLTIYWQRSTLSQLYFSNTRKPNREIRSAMIESTGPSRCVPPCSLAA